MSDSEQRLIEMIRDSKDPTKAIMIATDIIIAFLTPLRSSRTESSQDQQDRV